MRLSQDGFTLTSSALRPSSQVGLSSLSDPVSTTPEVPSVLLQLTCSLPSREHIHRDGSLPTLLEARQGFWLRALRSKCLALAWRTLLEGWVRLKDTLLCCRNPALFRRLFGQVCSPGSLEKSPFPMVLISSPRKRNGSLKRSGKVPKGSGVWESTNSTSSDLIQ